MTDIVKLKAKVRDSGLKTKYIYEKLGISRQTWYNRMNGRRPFTAIEVEKLCEILRISSIRERKEIFFTNM